ncbi:N-acylhomoserine lactone acylase HacB, partial [Pseudomonas aeruginosa]
GWWASAALPKRPEGVNPSFILDGSKGEADKSGFYPFADNPQEENPARGYIVSANFQPVPANGRPIPGYYNLADRGQWLDTQLADRGTKWNLDNSRALQLGNRTGYAPRLLAPLLPVLREVVDDAEGKRLVEQLAAWNGDYPVDSTAATLFNQLLFQIAESALHDELGDAFFDSLIATRAIDSALPRLAADADSPWWDDRRTERRETRADIVRAAWNASLAHLRGTLGNDPSGWLWGKAHTLTHEHALGQQALLKRLLNVGPFAAPGTHEVPNNLSAKIGPAPWAVTYGPSTRRLVDFADPTHSLGINPVGQSGVPFDGHYDDQAEAYIEGHYLPQHYEENEVKANSKGVLVLEPKR